MSSVTFFMCLGCGEEFQKEDAGTKMAEIGSQSKLSLGTDIWHDVHACPKCGGVELKPFEKEVSNQS